MGSVVPFVTAKVAKNSKSACEAILRNALIHNAEIEKGKSLNWPWQLVRIKNRLGVYHRNDYDRIVVKVDEDDIYSRLNDISENLGKKYDNFYMNHTQLSGFIKKIKKTSPVIDVKSICLKDDKDYCFTRIPWDIDKSATYEQLNHWKELLDRMTNRDAFLAFIGSILVGSKHEQYVWIYSSGGDGKSKAMDAIKDVLKDTMWVTNAPQGKYVDKFWTSKFSNASLVLMREASSSEFLKSNIFKSLVTREEVEIEDKYEKAINGIIEARYIITSNNLPEIDPEDHGMRRLILCTLSKPKKVTDSFREKIISENHIFFSVAVNKYHELYGDDGYIKQEESAQELAMDEASDVGLDVFHRYWEFKEGSREKSADVYGYLVSNMRIKPQEYKNYVSIWSKQLGIIKERSIDDRGKKITYLKNMKFKSSWSWDAGGKTNDD